MTGKHIQIHKVEVDAAWRWLARAWVLFTREVGMWLVYTVVVIIASLCVAFLIPGVGPLLWAFVAPLLFAGALFVAARIDRGEPVEVAHLLAGFTDAKHRTQLMILGAISAVSQLAIAALAFVLFGGTLLAAFASGEFSGFAVLQGIVGSLALVLVLSLVVAAGLLYACPLVYFQDAGAVEGIKASFRVSIDNLLPLAVAGVIFAVLAILATLVAGLGWLVLMPLTVTAVYVSYADMFAGERAPDAAGPDQQP
jgi:uncharacterized membrane protein